MMFVSKGVINDEIFSVRISLRLPHASSSYSHHLDGKTAVESLPRTHGHAELFAPPRKYLVSSGPKPLKEA